MFSSQMTNAANSLSLSNNAVLALGYFNALSNNSVCCMRSGRSNAGGTQDRTATSTISCEGQGEILGVEAAQIEVMMNFKV